MGPWEAADEPLRGRRRLPLPGGAGSEPDHGVRGEGTGVTRGPNGARGEGERGRGVLDHADVALVLTLDEARPPFTLKISPSHVDTDLGLRDRQPRPHSGPRPLARPARARPRHPHPTPTTRPEVREAI